MELDNENADSEVKRKSLEDDSASFLGTSFKEENDRQDDEENEKQRKFNDCIDISTVFKKQLGSQKYNQKPRPNYFYCVRIKNKEIIKLVDECQRDIIKRNQHIAKAAIKIETLHITLMAIHIRDRNQIENLNKNIVNTLKDIKLTDSLKLSFRGLSTFRNEVVYIDLEKNESYSSLLKFQKDLVKSIEKWDNIHLCEKNFTPHLTLMKLSKFKGSKKKGIKKISKNVYEHLVESHFGVEMVDEIHLCNMYEKQSDGFYKIEATHKFCGRDDDDDEEKFSTPSPPLPLQPPPPTEPSSVN